MSALPVGLGCSSISMQHLGLDEALAEIASLGFAEIDLGALPGVCDHVPFDLTEEAIASVAASIASSGLRVRSVNGDVGDLNAPVVSRPTRQEHLDRLLALTAAIGADALVLPCGSLGHDPLISLDQDIARVAAEIAAAAERAQAHGVEIWVESLHFLRLCWNAERAQALHMVLPESVRVAFDVAHVVAAGDDPVELIARWGQRIAHVHLRDAAAGEFSRAIGTADVDFEAVFAALAGIGYADGLALELPARAYSDGATDAVDAMLRRERRRAIADAAAYIVPRLGALVR